MKPHYPTFEHNYGSSTTNTSKPTSGLSEPHPQVTLSIADRNLLRTRLAQLRAEIDATIQMLDKQDHRTIDAALFEGLIMRWERLIDGALNPNG